MKKLLLLTTICVWTFTAKAQQIPSYGQYFVNPFLYNPAMAGAEESTRIFTLFRNQWAGIPGAPESQALTVDGPVNNKVGLGVTFYNDVNNIISRFGGLGTYRYRVPLAKDHTLSMGLSLGFSRTKIYFDRLHAEDPFDQAILDNFDNGTSFDGNFGLSYSHKRLRVGLSALQLFQNQVNFSNDAGDRNIGYKLLRHYLVSAQYAFFTRDGNAKIEPIVLLKSAQGLPIQMDLNLMATYKKNYWAGATWKMNSAMAFSLGTFLYDRITLGYSYEFATTKFATYNNGSHEVVVGFTFNKSSGGSSYKSSGDYSELSRQNKEQYELIDQIKQDNDGIKSNVAENQKTIEAQKQEIERLQTEIRKDRQEIDSVIRVSRVNVQEEKFDSETGNYYIVVGAMKTMRGAKAFQQILRRELNEETSIVQKSNGSYFFIYTHEVTNKNEALQELGRLKKINSKDLFVGDPWLYKHPR
jgi:type IX secretion system PorP/SprF family membrane protein